MRVVETLSAKADTAKVHMIAITINWVRIVVVQLQKNANKRSSNKKFFSRLKA